MKIKEIITMGMLTILMNLFLIKIIGLHDNVIPETKLMWIIGFFTGTIFTKLLIELFNNLEKEGGMKNENR